MSRTDNPPPQAATLEQIEQRLALLPPEKAAAIRARFASAPLRPPRTRDNVPLPSPRYTSDLPRIQGWAESAFAGQNLRRTDPISSLHDSASVGRGVCSERCFRPDTPG
jgi:hypothetical protein